MTRGEAGKKLNTILEAVDAFQAALPVALPGRHRERLNAIRDQVMLLALDLRLPVQPVEEKQDELAVRKPEDSQAG